MAAVPSVLRFRRMMQIHSTAFCLNVFGMNENIDITVFESSCQSRRESVPRAACMNAYKL